MLLQVELQRVLDQCTNPSDAASPDAFCEGPGLLTFRDGPKAQKEDPAIRSTLETLRPCAVDLQATVAAEAVTGLTTLPRGHTPQPSDHGLTD